MSVRAKREELIEKGIIPNNNFENDGEYTNITTFKSALFKRKIVASLHQNIVNQNMLFLGAFEYI